MDQPKDAATLGPVAAHNAIAALTSMYAGIIADYERNQAFLVLQVNQLRAALKDKHDATIPPEGATSKGSSDP
jgi:hypothetical protein